MLDLSYIIQDRKRRKMKRIYKRQTNGLITMRLDLKLIQSIESHMESIGKVNVYNDGSRTDIPLNTSGDYTLMNEHMGTVEMDTLKKKITR